MLLRWRKRRSICKLLRPLIALLAGLLQPSIATASESERLESIHFNSGQIDFGTIPRRGIVWNEPTDRPLRPGKYYADGSNNYAHYELAQDRDEARWAQRTELFDHLYDAAFRQEKSG